MPQERKPDQLVLSLQLFLGIQSAPLLSRTMRLPRYFHNPIPPNEEWVDVHGLFQGTYYTRQTNKYSVEDTMV